MDAGTKSLLSERGARSFGLDSLGCDLPPPPPDRRLTVGGLAGNRCRIMLNMPIGSSDGAPGLQIRVP